MIESSVLTLEMLLTLEVLQTLAYPCTLQKKSTYGGAKQSKTATVLFCIYIKMACCIVKLWKAMLCLIAT